MPLKKFRPNLSASREKSLAGAHQQLPTSSSASSAAVAESPTQLPHAQDTASLNSSHSTSDKEQLCEEAAVSHEKELSADEGTAGNDHTVQQSSTSTSVQKVNKVQRLRKKVAPCIPSRTRRLSARERASTSTPISDHNTKQTDQSANDLPTPVSPPSRSITSLTATATPDTSSTHIADEWPLVPPSAAFNTPDNALTTNTSLSSSLLEQSTFTPTETTDTGITSTPSLSESHHVADNTAGSSGTSQVHVQSPESSEQHEEPIPRRRGRGVARGRRGRGRRTPQAAETRSREEPSVTENVVASSSEPASNSSTPSKVSAVPHHPDIVYNLLHRVCGVAGEKEESKTCLISDWRRWSHCKFICEHASVLDITSLHMTPLCLKTCYTLVIHVSNSSCSLLQLQSDAALVFITVMMTGMLMMSQ